MANQKSWMSDIVGPVDYLFHRGEVNPRTRSDFMSIELLDGIPDWQQFRRHIDLVSRQVLRLRQKIVAPALPTAPAHWVVDPDFDLDYHVRRVRVPQPGRLREVFDLAEVFLHSPLDLSRPLWVMTLVEGIEGGRGAVLCHLSHAITDGVGASGLLSKLYDQQPHPPKETMPLPPSPQELSSGRLMIQGIRHLPYFAVDSALGALSTGLKLTGEFIRRPENLIAHTSDYAQSCLRVIRQAAKPSPLLAKRSLASHTEALDLRLEDIAAVAHLTLSSINDVYLAGLAGGLSRYHQILGVNIPSLPMAVPISLRTQGDPMGGNQFSGVNLALPLNIFDPFIRIQYIRRHMQQCRHEQALGIVDTLAPVVSLFPRVALDKLAGSILHSDIQASNVAFFPFDTYVSGHKVLNHYALGPLPGVAIMAILLSRAGKVSITLRYDRAAIRDEELFVRCMVNGFTDILALSPDCAQPAVVLASEHA